MKPETDRNLEAKERGGRKRKERDGVRGRRERTRAGAAYDAGTGGGIARLFVLYNEDGTLLGKTECAASEPLKAWEWTKVDLALRNFVLAVLCFFAALALARLAEPPFRQPEAERPLAVFTPLRVDRLTADNLADAMAAMPLGNRILRVGWDHAILTVDLAARPGPGQPAAIWEDVVTLARFSFAQVSNVNRLLVRVYEAGNRTGNALLIAADSRREDWTPQRLDALISPRSLPDGDWRSQFRLLVTPAGRRWLDSAAE